MVGWMRIITGAALLLSGRRLFWFSVGLLGLAAGALVAGELVDAGPVLTVGIGLLGGLVGILLALFLQSLAIGLAGAGLIVPALDLDRPAAALGFFGLALIGVIVQAATKGNPGRVQTAGQGQG